MTPVKLMCRAAGVSRSGYYASRRRPQSRRAGQDRCLTTAIRAIFKESRKTYGSPRVWAELRDRGIRCGRKRVERLMRCGKIVAVRRQSVRPADEASHSWPVAPNVLDGNFRVEWPDRVWVSDISYIPTDEGWLYLAVVLDLCSRRVVGWATDPRRDRRLSCSALEMALGRRRPRRGLLHHSDQGGQYACWDYQQLLEDNGLRCSMSRRGNPYDNAAMESFFKTLKTELVHRRRFATREEAKAAIVEYIETFYNCRRRHSALGYLSPAEYEAVRQPSAA